MRAEALPQRAAISKKRRLPCGKWVDFALGAALGAVFFLLLYGPSTLNVGYDAWIYKGYIEKDIVQNYAGWMFYRASGLGWPLAVADNLSVPYGVSIAYTDSIPYASIFFKLLAPLLPATFQYYGWYTIGCFMLQGGFAVLLLRHFALPRPYSLVASLLFLSFPIFVEKAFRHVGLASQWLVLAALLLYLESAKNRCWPLWAGFAALCALSVGTSIYFLPMVGALLVAALARWAVNEKRLLCPAAVLAGCAVLTLGCCYAIGILTRNGGSVTGFDTSLGMNLNALINPSSFDAFAADEVFDWSLFLPLHERPRIQYEGFNYLGAGLLLAWALLLVATVLRWLRHRVGPRVLWGHIKAFFAAHWALVAVCLFLCVYAVGFRVWWGLSLLIDWRAPLWLQSLCGIFRASGRMLWPISYMLALAPVVALYRRALPLAKGCAHAKTVLPMAALALLVAVQLADLSPALIQKNRHFAGAITAEDYYTSEEWRFFAESYDYAVLLNRSYNYDMAAGLIRYNPAIRTNMIIANRGDFPLIRDGYPGVIEYLSMGKAIEPGTVYICEEEQTALEVRKGLGEGIAAYYTGERWLFALPQPGCPLQPLPRPAQDAVVEEDGT